jgi:hypothetical protein
MISGMTSKPSPASPERIATSKGKHNNLKNKLLLWENRQPPDERTVRELNRLAAGPPFCFYYKAKRHETL